VDVIIIQASIVMPHALRTIMLAPAVQRAAMPDYRKLEMPRDYATPVLDNLQRPLRDLRISVTDRCNLRCRARYSTGVIHLYLAPSCFLLKRSNVLPGSSSGSAYRKYA
jgi:hypothetical protein